MSRKLNTQEPLVLASQAQQAYYVRGIKDPTWSTIIETKLSTQEPFVLACQESSALKSHLC